MRPVSLAEVAERSQADPDWHLHLDEFLDTFYGADGDTGRQAAMLSDEPFRLGEAKADAFLGGVGEHLARRWHLPMPAWVRNEARYLHAAMFWPDRVSSLAYMIAVTPIGFRTRLIFTGPEPLQRARFPYRRGIVQFPFNEDDPLVPKVASFAGTPPLA